jgi:uncharacterized OsmC-like protein
LSQDTIDGGGDPLGFKFAAAHREHVVFAGRPGESVLRVEARKMAGHQKEALVTEGEGGDVWRVVSDEGPGLKGTDLAPFPLAFFNAAMHGDYLNRALALARAHQVLFDEVSVALDNQYYFSGSFFKGTGQGSAEPVAVRVAARSRAAPDLVARVLDAALEASPVHAAFAAPLVNTFALYVNGRRTAVKRVAPSCAPDAADPLLAHRRAPAPLADADTLGGIIARLDPDTAAAGPKVIPPEGRVPIPIRGAAALVDPAGVVATTVLPASAGARFRLLSDERPAGRRAPTAIAYAAAGVAFCFMTQLGRYIEHRHYKVHGLRVVQSWAFNLSGRAEDFTLRGGVSPVDTHVFLHADEPDDVMQTLLEIAENTCYLHAALRSTLPGRIEATLNRAPLAQNRR